MTELLAFEGDKKFAVYADELERSLALFERAHEWADLIKCLQKVAGTLQKYGPAHSHLLPHFLPHSRLVFSALWRGCPAQVDALQAPRPVLSRRAALGYTLPLPLRTPSCPL